MCKKLQFYSFSYVCTKCTFVCLVHDCINANWRGHCHLFCYFGSIILSSQAKKLKAVLADTFLINNHVSKDVMVKPCLGVPKLSPMPETLLMQTSTKRNTFWAYMAMAARLMPITFLLQAAVSIYKTQLLSWEFGMNASLQVLLFWPASLP